MQNVENHRQYYPAHHFVFYPLILACVVVSIYFHFTEKSWIWLAIGVLFIFIGWLSFMLRQHYGIGLQNRIILLELQVRYMQAGKDFGKLQSQLSQGQLFALRFASDEELLELTDEAIAKNLSPGEIKKAIRSWKGDYLRI